MKFAPMLPHRPTRSSLQRRLVRQITEASRDHPTALAVFERAREKMPAISLGTVYRNLQLLVDQGLLLERKIGKKPARYEARRQRHYHICCLECGALEDLAVPYQETLDRRVERMMRYRLQEHRMEFYGVCPRCQARRGGWAGPVASQRVPIRQSASRAVSHRGEAKPLTNVLSRSGEGRK